MRRSRKMAIALTICFLAALTAVVIYPTRGTPPEQSDPWRSPWYRLRYDFLANFPAHADLVMLGDSLTEWGDWRAMLADIDTANQGIAGDTTAGLLRRLDFAKRTGARAIAVMIGVNDLLARQPVSDVFGRYDQAIGALVAPGRCIIVQSTLLTRRFDASLNAAIGDLDRRLAATCSGERCNFVDLNAVLAPDGELAADATIDGLHLNIRGYTLWREALLPHLAACLRR